MKVAFDQQVFLLQEYGGISRYICNLARSLSGFPEVEARIFAPLHSNRNLSEIGGVPTSGLYLPKTGTKVSRITNELSKQLAWFSMRRFEPDIVHETYFTNKCFRASKAPRVLTVYDMIHERYADDFENNQGTTVPKQLAASRADKIICISKNTQRDLVTYCGIDEAKTSVIYLSADRFFEVSDEQRAAREANSRPYLLYVGARTGYKNFAAFLKSFAASKSLSSGFDIVCFGGGLFSDQEKQLITQCGLTQGQVRQEFGDDGALRTCYLQATAFVYPSLYEGFGIPPLEAMAAQCPVVCSNTSSLPEVVGNASELFDPTSVESIKDAMENVALYDARRVQLIALGKLRYREFSWERCAEETLSTYQELV